MNEQRRGFFRDALLRLQQLAHDEEPRPSFVPPPQVPPKRSPKPAPRVKRPPGAIEEAAFLSACTRCGACIAACPEGTLVAHEGAYPSADLFLHACVMCHDVPCASACMTGALTHGGPIAFGTARVSAKLCLNQGRPNADDEDDGPCERCVDWCPVPLAITLGLDAMPVIDQARCSGCGLCAAHCAAYPQAITLV